MGAASGKGVRPPERGKPGHEHRSHPDRPRAAMFFAAAIANEDRVGRKGPNGVEGALVDPRIRFANPELIGEDNRVEPFAQR